eukprot:TRINITY_DN1644_c0_g1_i2.p1 TRINITY_DN1644_c0_g1~~TRINITY_DN1644_c0_g1_i2.p1  ORF type:complete len:437 (+),score=92.58 TRINITY_DN1644_c0_g1_i2:149-1459(+)
MSEEGLLRTRPATQVKEGDRLKYAAFVVIGIITLGYSIFEITLALKMHSLALMSDGFHNLSDVIALMIAFWALWKSNAAKNHKMTYGWKRAEILGAVMNGCFLVALALYIVLESIPKFISPDFENTRDWWFVIVAGTGLGVNLLGTVVFAATGTHGHSHAGGGGGHSHGEGHSHDHKKDKEKHGHGHGDKKEKKEKHGHGHGETKEKHGHGHGDKKDKHGHGHGEHKEVVDLNVRAVFIHYLGDAISSLFVLAAGLIMQYYPDEDWIGYVDPASSLLIVILIIASVVPLIINCSKILLQRAPTEIDCHHLKTTLQQVEGIKGIHDLHVWELVDSMIIASLHVTIWECDSETFKKIVARCKKVLHRFGIHSSTLQPEFVPRSPSMIESKDICLQNCTKDCSEDWCCKEEHVQNMDEMESLGDDDVDVSGYEIGSLNR